MLGSAQRRLEQAARDAFEREEGGSDDDSDVSDDLEGYLEGYQRTAPPRPEGEHEYQ